MIATFAMLQCIVFLKLTQNLVDPFPPLALIKLGEKAIRMTAPDLPDILFENNLPDITCAIK